VPPGTSKEILHFSNVSLHDLFPFENSSTFRLPAAIRAAKLTSADVVDSLMLPFAALRILQVL
jgi:hypothetical protein